MHQDGPRRGDKLGGNSRPISKKKASVAFLQPRLFEFYRSLNYSNFTSILVIFLLSLFKTSSEISKSSL